MQVDAVEDEFRSATLLSFDQAVHAVQSAPTVVGVAGEVLPSEDVSSRCSGSFSMFSDEEDSTDSSVSGCERETVFERQSEAAGARAAALLERATSWREGQSRRRRARLRGPGDVDRRVMAQLRMAMETMGVSVEHMHASGVPEELVSLAETVLNGRWREGAIEACLLSPEFAGFVGSVDAQRTRVVAGTEQVSRRTRERPKRTHVIPTDTDWRLCRQRIQREVDRALYGDARPLVVARHRTCVDTAVRGLSPVRDGTWAREAFSRARGRAPVGARERRRCRRRKRRGGGPTRVTTAMPDALERERVRLLRARDLDLALDRAVRSSRASL